MSKLDGNERWKSKMLLTEHQEQYQERNNKTLIGRATTDELRMIRDVIMFPHMLTMSDKSLQEVRRTPNLYKSYFEQFYSTGYGPNHEGFIRSQARVKIAKY